MQAFERLTVETIGPVASVTLNRPAERNAMSARMVEELLRCFVALRDDPVHNDVRVVVLRAAGEVFCAGGDLRDLASGAAPNAERVAVGRLDELLRTVNEGPQVVVARVHGAALGGGLGLICVSDIAIAGARASLGLPEVRLGLAPAIIAPYVIARVGLTRARQLMLTGRRCSAAEAVQFGLIHHWCPDDELDTAIDATVREILACAPQALRECKRLLFKVAAGGETLDYRIDLLNRLRASDEAREGMQAFLTKQPAPWVPQP